MLVADNEFTGYSLPIVVKLKHTYNICLYCYTSRSQRHCNKAHYGMCYPNPKWLSLQLRFEYLQFVKGALTVITASCYSWALSYQAVIFVTSPAPPRISIHFNFWHCPSGQISSTVVQSNVNLFPVWCNVLLC